MADATFKAGDPIMVDYTPGSAVTGGSVKVIGVNPYVLHRDIAANIKGAIAARHGIYDMTADAALAEGVKVYWNDTSKKVTATSSGNKHFGYVAPGSSSAADGDTIRIQHQPNN